MNRILVTVEACVITCVYAHIIAVTTLSHSEALETCKPTRISSHNAAGRTRSIEKSIDLIGI
jgi:hypothetical protein